MSFDFRKWYNDAHDLVSIVRSSSAWRGRCEECYSSFLAFDFIHEDTSANELLELVKKTIDDSRALSNAMLSEVANIQEARARLSEQVGALSVILEAAALELRDFEAVGVAKGQFAWMAIDLLAEQIIERGKRLAYCLTIKTARAPRANQSDETKSLAKFYETKWESFRKGWDEHDKQYRLEQICDGIKTRLALEKNWLLKNATPALVIPEANAKTSPPLPPKNKGGKPPKTTPERAEQVNAWWEQFKKDPNPKGYKKTKPLRERSSDHFIEWGEFLKLQDFPKTRKEVDRCKKRYRDLHPPKSAKTKTPKRH